jgi:hypothetical protein
MIIGINAYAQLNYYHAVVVLQIQTNNFLYEKVRKNINWLSRYTN